MRITETVPGIVAALCMPLSKAFRFCMELIARHIAMIMFAAPIAT